jgi:hypothetical protein
MDQFRALGQRIGLPAEKLPEARAQLDARAQMQANLLAELKISIDQQSDQFSQLLTLVRALAEQLPTGIYAAHEAVYAHQNTTDVQPYDLDVPDGDWAIDRVITFTNSATGGAGTAVVGVRGLFGQAIWYPAEGVHILNVPIVSRRLELIPASAQTAGAFQVFVFVLRQQR